jgi:MIP family channel proteins
LQANNMFFPKSAKWGIPRNVMGFNSDELDLKLIDTKAVATEFIGSLCLVLIGCGTACSNGWSDAQSRMLVAFAFGMTTMILAYSIGQHSGGQFNVAVTFSLVLAAQVPLAQGIANALAQFFASLIAAGILCVVFPCSTDLTRNIGSNIINTDYADPGRCIVAEAFGTLLLCTAIFETAVTNKTNSGKNACIAIGFATFVAHILLLPIDGCSMNPTRSTGSAIVSKLRGCENLLEGGLHDLWVMWVGPMIGAVFTGLPRNPAWVALAKRYRLFE